MHQDRARLYVMRPAEIPRRPIHEHSARRSAVLAVMQPGTTTTPDVEGRKYRTVCAYASAALRHAVQSASQAAARADERQAPRRARGVRVAAARLVAI